MSDHPALLKDDRFTLIAISALGSILQNLLHEGLGHGFAAWLGGAHRIVLSTVALQSEVESRSISASGTLANLLFGAIFWLLLRKPERYGPRTRYFLALAMTGNLFTGTGYFLFSGVSNWGDWAGVIEGLEPRWFWRLGLVAVGLGSYYGSMRLAAAALKPFEIPQEGLGRLRGLCWTPYFTGGVVAGLGALQNPFGWFYLLAAVLPSTLGASSGLLSLPSLVRHQKQGARERVPAIGRSPGWIAAAAVATLLFSLVLGRGVTWMR